ncbi:MAG: sigma-70 family RNA polymerase sigma factor [Nannocystaceae bacterium]|nr:sigma-70 family RNA polymerase sigma factor [Nannocystaceae bacterium]
MSEPDPDTELLARWTGGDTEAGGILFDRYFAAIARFFRNKVADSLAVQDDLVQSTFTACLESSARFRGEGSFRSFLFSIAYNVLRRHYEHRRRDARVDFGSVSVHDLAKGASSLLAEHAELALLTDALRRLPVQLQTAIELHYWEGASMVEIGAVLQWPTGTVKSRLRRARAQLRAYIEAAETTANARRAALEAVSDGFGPTPSTE